MKKSALLLATVLFSALISAEEPVRVCGACGREDFSGGVKCACGNLLPPVPAASVAPPAEPQPAKPLPGSMPESVREAKADVDAARKCARENPLLSFSLYKNALALLSADTTGSNRAASDSLAAELAGAKEAMTAHLATYTSVESARVALKKSLEDAALHHKTLGRKALGGAWVPVTWIEKLLPLQVAAIRQTVPPSCAACSGLGYEASCTKCGGSKLVTCTAKGCERGWIVVAPLNTLNPKNATKTRQKCQICKGGARVPCKACSGKGTTFCKKCKGAGEAPLCGSCRGDGLVPCKECEKKISKDPGANIAACRKCNGTLKTVCPRCGGDGRIAR